MDSSDFNPILLKKEYFEIIRKYRYNLSINSSTIDDIIDIIQIFYNHNNLTYLFSPFYLLSIVEVKILLKLNYVFDFNCPFSFTFKAYQFLKNSNILILRCYQNIETVKDFIEFKTVNNLKNSNIFDGHTLYYYFQLGKKSNYRDIKNFLKSDLTLNSVLFNNQYDSDYKDLIINSSNLDSIINNNYEYPFHFKDIIIDNLIWSGLIIFFNQLFDEINEKKFEEYLYHHINNQVTDKKIIEKEIKWVQKVLTHHRYEKITYLYSLYNFLEKKYQNIKDIEDIKDDKEVKIDDSVKNYKKFDLEEYLNKHIYAHNLENVRYFNELVEDDLKDEFLPTLQLSIIYGVEYLNEKNQIYLYKFIIKDVKRNKKSGADYDPQLDAIYRKIIKEKYMKEADELKYLIGLEKYSVVKIYLQNFQIYQNILEDGKI